MQIISMDNNVDKCSAVKCTAPHPLKKIFFNVSFCIGVSIRIGREIRCFPYAGFFLVMKLLQLSIRLINEVDHMVTIT